MCEAVGERPNGRPKEGCSSASLRRCVAPSPAKPTTDTDAALSNTKIPERAQVEISEGGTIPASALKKITAGGDGVGLRCYDNG